MVSLLLGRAAQTKDQIVSGTNERECRRIVLANESEPIALYTAQRGIVNGKRSRWSDRPPGTDQSPFSIHEPGPHLHFTVPTSIETHDDNDGAGPEKRLTFPSQTDNDSAMLKERKATQDKSIKLTNHCSLKLKRQY